MEKFAAQFWAEGPDPSASTVYVDSKEFATQNEAEAFGKRVYGDAFVGVVKVGGNEPF